MGMVCVISVNACVPRHLVSRRSLQADPPSSPSRRPKWRPGGPAWGGGALLAGGLASVSLRSHLGKRYTGCRYWLSSPGALSGLATRVLVSLTPLRRSAFWPRLVGLLRCSSHLCWCVWFFPTAGFSGWVAELSSLRFGPGLQIGIFSLAAGNGSFIIKLCHCRVS